MNTRLEIPSLPFSGVLLCVIDPRVRKIRNEASRYPETSESRELSAFTMSLAPPVTKSVCRAHILWIQESIPFILPVDSLAENHKSLDASFLFMEDMVQIFKLEKQNQLLLLILGFKNAVFDSSVFCFVSLTRG